MHHCCRLDRNNTVRSWMNHYIITACLFFDVAEPWILSSFPWDSSGYFCSSFLCVDAALHNKPMKALHDDAASIYTTTTPTTCLLLPLIPDARTESGSGNWWCCRTQLPSTVHIHYTDQHERCWIQGYRSKTTRAAS